MDDDIDLFYDQRTILNSTMLRSTMRYFEQFLLEREPGIGVVNLPNYYGADFILDKIWENCNIRGKLTSLPSNRTSLLSVYLTPVHFDALFNAFHRDVVDHILPYNIDYDDQDWTLSQRYVISLVELKFRGQVVMFTPVSITNFLHREHPRNLDGLLDIWRNMTQKLISTMPDKYQENVRVKEHLDNPMEYTDNSHTVCFLLPQTHSFEMYSHFELDWSID